METHTHPQYLQAPSCDPNLKPDQLVQLCVVCDRSSGRAPPGGRLYTQTALYLSHWHQTVRSPDDDVTAQPGSPSAEKLQELTLPSWPRSSVVLPRHRNPPACRSHSFKLLSHDAVHRKCPLLLKQQSETTLPWLLRETGNKDDSTGRQAEE